MLEIAVYDPIISEISLSVAVSLESQCPEVASSIMDIVRSTHRRFWNFRRTWLHKRASYRLPTVEQVTSRRCNLFEEKRTDDKRGRYSATHRDFYRLKR